MKRSKLFAIIACSVVAGGIATSQIMQVIKVVGVGAAVKQFGPQINKEMNKLTKHSDTPNATTKVVPILTIGVSSSSAIGAAQVMGPKSQVDKVQAVAQPAVDLFGKEIRIRGLIPVASKDVLKDVRRVDKVAVTGIVDLKL